jgi:hypothetical protein
MPVPTLANTWKVVVHYSSGSTQFENVLHVTADDGSDATDIAQDIGNAWGDSASLSSIQANLVVGGMIDVQHYDGLSGPINVNVPGFTGVSMADSGSPVPAAVCGLITLRSGLSGRSNRGRMYLGGVSDTHLETDGARWASGAFPELALVATNFHDLVLAGTVTNGLDIYSPLHNTKVPCIEMIFRHYFGTQRRRAAQAE